MSMTEICEVQNTIIKLQSDIIDDLFLQLMQYVAIEDEEKELSMMEEAATLRQEIQT